MSRHNDSVSAGRQLLNVQRGAFIPALFSPFWCHRQKRTQRCAKRRTLCRSSQRKKCHGTSHGSSWRPTCNSGIWRWWNLQRDRAYMRTAVEKATDGCSDDEFCSEPRPMTALEFRQRRGEDQTAVANHVRKWRIQQPAAVPPTLLTQFTRSSAH